MLPEWYLALIPIMSYPILWVVIIAIILFLFTLGLAVLFMTIGPLFIVFSLEEVGYKLRLIAALISAAGFLIALPVLGAIDQTSELTIEPILKQFSCYNLWIFEDNEMLGTCNANSMAHVYYHELCESCSNYNERTQENRAKQ